MLDKTKKAIADRLIDDAWTQAKQMWSVRLQLFWAAVMGLYGIWPAFGGYVSTPVLCAGSIGMSLAILVARLTKQTGVE